LREPRLQGEKYQSVYAKLKLSPTNQEWLCHKALPYKAARLIFITG